VKIDPKSIGVGQYQHDVSPHALKMRLDQVVDSAVNQTGVNLNTASSHLLAHVSGIGPALGRAIVSARETNGVFRSRQELLKVPRFTKKTFEQAAGFLRIPDGDHPLDNTGVHPERYEALEVFADGIGKKVVDLLGGGVSLLKPSIALKDSLGAFTFEDVVKELEKPGRDPRETFVPFSFREGIRELKDLEVGMICPGIVTNVTNFGAFVDIGVHQDGLAHISQLSDRFVKDPREVVNPGDRVQVKVLGVNLEKSQISLTMKLRETVPMVAPTPSTRGDQGPRHPQPPAAGQTPPKPEPKTVDRRWAALERLGR
jgi:protein Tex